MKKVLVGSNGVIVSSGNALCLDTLPDEYTRLQYITAGGSSALNTGVVIDQSDTILVDYELEQLSMRGDKFIISGQANGSGGGIWVETYDPTNRWYVRFGSPSSANIAPSSSHLTGRHTFEVRKGYFGVDGSTVLSPAYSSMYSKPLNVGGRLKADGHTIQSGFYGRLYEVKILDENDRPRWWGIPAMDANDVAGLYDLVSDAFFPSDTAAAFSAGPNA